MSNEFHVMTRCPYGLPKKVGSRAWMTMIKAKAEGQALGGLTIINGDVYSVAYWDGHVYAGPLSDMDGTTTFETQMITKADRVVLDGWIKAYSRGDYNRALERVEEVEAEARTVSIF